MNDDLTDPQILQSGPDAVVTGAAVFLRTASFSPVIHLAEDQP